MKAKNCPYSCTLHWTGFVLGIPCVRALPVFCPLCGTQGRGGGVMGWVIRIIFDPNTRQWGGGGGFMG